MKKFILLLLVSCNQHYEKKDSIQSTIDSATIRVQLNIDTLMGGGYDMYDSSRHHFGLEHIIDDEIPVSKWTGATKAKPAYNIGRPIDLSATNTDTVNRWNWSDLDVSKWAGSLTIDTAWPLRKIRFTEWCVNNYEDRACRDSIGKWTITGDTTSLMEILFQEFKRTADQRDSLMAVLIQYRFFTDSAGNLLIRQY